MGENWRTFRTMLRRIRATETTVAKGEFDPGRIGVSASVFGLDGEILGSIGLVL